ncbi:hypothetical protein SCT_0384 [Sulfuricella sp. T08]|uniref:restriction endonuclease subunit S n=1 Tax=Sulfuricella sp. T08 TaxID=1632857 RepID=UPI00061795B6|nr:restriction endonuclease subunit S [Sulfuricella sp. T08]GAO35004.1 hypothetical protein SCT_0384 [Sulfuricella sp. T08]
MLLDIRPDYLQIVQDILQKHVPQYEVWAFGSRAKWTAKEYSDLDLCVVSDKPLSFSVLGAIGDDFSNSDLPWKVDIVDWATTSASFRKIIERDKVVVQKRSCGMSSEWTEVRLEEITTILGDGLHGTPEYDDQGDYYFINGNNLNDGRIIFNENTRCTPASEFDKHKKDLNNRTILVSINGTLGNVALYRGEKVVLGKSACYFNVREGVDKQFVRYVITSDLFQNYIHNLATGSTIKNVSLRLMRNFRFMLPPLELQEKISATLVALDDKIALLRETNTTLEAIAQALFKSWFVDFDPVRAKAEGRVPEGMDEATSALFPDSFEESELGLVPRGWQVGTVEEVAAKIFSGGTPDTRRPQFWKGDLRWFSSGETRNKIVIETEKRISQEAVAGSSTKLALPGDILIASAGQGHTRGQTSYCAVQTYINQSVVAVRASSDNCSPEWLYFNLSRRYEEMRNLSDSHSSRGSLTTKLLGGMPVLIPSPSSIQAFSSLASVALKSQAENERQAQTLATLRDTLLPRLLSGKLRLTDSEPVEEAA